MHTCITHAGLKRNSSYSSVFTRRAGVWMAPFGDGTVVFFGWNWRTFTTRDAQPPGSPSPGKNWTAVLHLALGLAKTKDGQRALSTGEM